MAGKATKRLTNIKPSEVSFVDNAANGKDYAVVKNKDGKLQPLDGKTQPSEGETKPVMKKMEVAIHTINCMKGDYPTLDNAKEFLKSQGVSDVDSMEVVEKEYEWRFIVNSIEKFEGSSMSYPHWVALHKGVDSIVGVLKGMKKEDVVNVLKSIDFTFDEETTEPTPETETTTVEEILAENVEVAKAGKKLSKKSLEKLQTAQKAINEILDSVGETLVAKNEENPDAPSDAPAEPVADAEPEKTDSSTAEPADAPAAEGSDDATAAPVAESTPSESVEEAVQKALKPFSDKLAEKDVEIAELKKKLDDLGDLPGDSQDAGDDAQPVEKNQTQSVWSGVL